MFWQFNDWVASKIDQVLDEPDVTLEKVMAEDDVIQECKAQNAKLVQFLTRPEVMEQLVNLVIREPDSSLPAKTRFKNANIACELLTVDIESMNNALIANNFLDAIYSFLESENDLNPLLASFVSKIWSLLIIKKTGETLNYLRNKDSFVSLFVRHIKVSAINDLLMKMISGIDNVEARDSVVSRLSSKSLISHVVDILNSPSYDCQNNAAQVICDIIKFSREQQSQLQDKASANPLLDEIESSETVRKILQIMMTSKSNSIIVQGTKILQSLIEYKRHSANINQPPPPPPPIEDDSERPEFEAAPQCVQQQPAFERSDGTVESALDANRLAKSVCQVHDAVIPKLKELTDILRIPSDDPPIPSTVGTLKPLGSARLEVAHFIRALLSGNNPAINRAFADIKMLDILVTLFFEYPWNSFLHIQVEQIIKIIFENTRKSSPVTSPLTSSQERDSATSWTEGQVAAKLLAKELLVEARLPSRITFVWNECNKKDESSKNKPRPGFMGHVIKIANHINDAVSSDEEISGWLKEIPSADLELWESFVSTSLKEVNNRLNTPLIADAPSLEDHDDPQRESLLAQGFLEFYMQHMTANLCSEIGFQMNEFTEPDGPTVRSRADQLSKINCDLDGQMNNSDSGVGESGNDEKKENKTYSSDEDDELFDDEADSNTTPRPMEIEVNNSWNSHPTTSKPWGSNGIATNQDENWADFGGFQSDSTTTAGQEVEKMVTDEPASVNSPQSNHETMMDDSSTERKETEKDGPQEIAASSFEEKITTD